MLNFTAIMKNKQSLTIGFDAKRAFLNNTGLGNYSRLVAATMAAVYPHNKYVLFTTKVRENKRIEPLLMRDNIDVFSPQGLWKKCPALWRTFTMGSDVAAKGVDIFHGLSNEIPVGPMPCPTVVTVHDLIWRRVPQDYAAVDRMLYDMKYRASARRATRIIAISEKTRDDIVQDWNIDPAKIDVIYQGCDPIFSQHIDYEKRQQVLDKYGIVGRYIISVGTVQSRKNQLLTIKAIEALPQDVKLVIVGGSERKYGMEVEKTIGKLNLSNRVKWLKNVPFDHLPYLYSGAELSAYTSRYEGFGIPVIESLNSGTPVVACTGSCLEEAGGPGALYVGADDVKATADAINSILEKRYLHDRLVEAGRRHVKKFNSKDFATSLMATYNKALVDYILSRN